MFWKENYGLRFTQFVNKSSNFVSFGLSNKGAVGTQRDQML